MRLLFSSTLFLSALLLFSIQPMVAKELLPVYGGTPAVWTVCMLFFQLILFLAYGYIWSLSRLPKVFWWRNIHFILAGLSITLVPLTFQPIASQGVPEWAILTNLISQLGLPLLVLAASAPLLQFAYSQTQYQGSADPYHLYTASNLGSLIALLVYPLVIEKNIGLNKQFDLWNIGYFIYLFCLFWVLFIPSYQSLQQFNSQKHHWLWLDLFFWILLAFIPCSLMLGVTLYISTDVAATPLFWVLPLALYLLTFVITFTNQPIIRHAWVVRCCLPLLTLTVFGFIMGVNRLSAWQVIGFNLVSFFILALFCHRELFLRRPQPVALPLFYFCLALGGVIAGIFNGLIAPHWFNQVYEYPLAILLSLLFLPEAKILTRFFVFPIVLSILILSYFLPHIELIPAVSLVQIIAISIWVALLFWRKNKWDLVLSVMTLFVFIFSPALEKNTLLFQERNFYGVKQVLSVNHSAHVLISQSTVHGIQPMDEEKPLSGFRSYYGPTQSLIESMQYATKAMKVTIVGLGSGIQLCQFRADDSVQVIEVDPQVIDLAKNPKLFTYLRDCLPHTEVIQNDGRLALANVADHSQHLIILDAFNSDAIPVHLMTREAFRLYQKKLEHNGVILVNLSNRHIDLLPLVNAMGRTLQLMVFTLTDEGNPKLGQFNSKWALLTENDSLAVSLMNGFNWHFLTSNHQVLWTDDYSNTLSLIRWL